MKTYFIGILSISILCVSCENILFEEEQASKDPFVNLNYLWNQCDQKYPYFELKEVDWDSVRWQYEAQLFFGMSEDSLFNVMAAMLNELRDDHVNLVSSFATSFYGVEYSAQDNFDWRLIVDHYITPHYVLSGPFAHNFLANGEIGYVRLSSFQGTIDPSHLDYVLIRYRHTKGLILDLRENGGGAIANVFQILSRFVEKETTVYASRIKAGPGRNDYSEIQYAHVVPHDGIRYDREVVVLTDRGTYSSGSLFALAVKSIPNMTSVGDTTGGGLGLPNGGQLPNGWTYRFSITQTLSLTGDPSFENGVPSDSTVQFNWNATDRDEIIDAALLILD